MGNRNRGEGSKEKTEGKVRKIVVLKIDRAQKERRAGKD
jgi:hypothetical protein